jgi:hypothetical protein
MIKSKARDEFLEVELACGPPLKEKNAFEQINPRTHKTCIAPRVSRKVL